MYLCKEKNKSGILNKYKNVLCKIKRYKVVLLKRLGASLVSSALKKHVSGSRVQIKIS